MKPLPCLSSALLLAIGRVSLAHTWSVDASGKGIFLEIQQGIDASSSGDTVLVGPGRYLEDVDFQGKALVVISSSGPEVTIIDASDEDSAAVMFRRSEGKTTLIEGFTITGGHGLPSGSQSEGGGIYCFGSSPEICGNVLVDNSATFGGGIHAIGGQPNIHDNVIRRNSAYYNGGGVRLVNCSATCADNILDENTAGSDGGGIDIRLTYGITLVLSRNVLRNNNAGDHGGGLQVYTDPLAPPAHVVVTLNIIDHNFAAGRETDDTGSGGGMCANNMSGTIASNTIVFNSVVGENSCAGGGIKLDEISDRLTITNNIIAFNTGCGMSCRHFANPNLGRNLLWQNSINDVGTEPFACGFEMDSTEFVSEDPQFCAPDEYNFSVASTSPALRYAVALGAIADPGCPGVHTETTTWSSIKTRFRE